MYSHHSITLLIALHSVNFRIKRLCSGMAIEMHLEGNIFAELFQVPHKETIKKSVCWTFTKGVVWPLDYFNHLEKIDGRSLDQMLAYCFVCWVVFFIFLLGCFLFCFGFFTIFTTRNS